jgi:hypothetical protein
VMRTEYTMPVNIGESQSTVDRGIINIWACRGAPQDQLGHHLADTKVTFAILNCLTATLCGELDGQDANHAQFNAW